LEVSNQFWWCSLILCDVFGAFMVSLNSFRDRRHYVWCLILLLQQSLAIISGFCDFRQLLWYLLFFFFLCVCVPQQRLCCHAEYDGPYGGYVVLPSQMLP